MTKLPYAEYRILLYLSYENLYYSGHDTNRKTFS